MGLSDDEARELLRNNGLRSTGPRLAVVRLLARSERPLSHSEVLAQLGDNAWDPATIYRNLVKLRQAGVASVISRVSGIDRYSLVLAHDEHHDHPHFVCDDCGRVSCLPAELTATMSMPGPWADSIHKAMVQFTGNCPQCTQRNAKARA